jgi:hypothetical protein
VFIGWKREWGMKEGPKRASLYDLIYSCNLYFSLNSINLSWAHWHPWSRQGGWTKVGKKIKIKWSIIVGHVSQIFNLYFILFYCYKSCHIYSLAMLINHNINIKMSLEGVQTSSPRPWNRSFTIQPQLHVVTNSVIT